MKGMIEGMIEGAGGASGGEQGEEASGVLCLHWQWRAQAPAVRRPMRPCGPAV